MQELEARLGRPLVDVIGERYTAGLGQAEIASELGVDPATVSRWMARLGIRTRRSRA